MKKRNNKKGFTLIELIVVIAILAILAAVAVPNFIGLTTKANVAVAKTGVVQYANAINIYNALNPTTQIKTDDIGTISSLPLTGLEPDTNLNTGNSLSGFIKVEDNGVAVIIDGKTDDDYIALTKAPSAG